MKLIKTVTAAMLLVFGLPAWAQKDTIGVSKFTEYVTWFVPDGKGQFASQRVDYQKMPAAKFLAYKKKVLGNSRYVKDPTYYAPDPMAAFGYVESSWNAAGETIQSVAGVAIVSNPRKYQPLELK